LRGLVARPAQLPLVGAALPQVRPRRRGTCRVRVCHVASEVTPWSQTGGLGEVVGALPAALARIGGGGVEVAVVTPLYRATRARAAQLGARLEDTGIEVAV